MAREQERTYLRDCDKCGESLYDGDNHEFGHGTYCQHCAQDYYEPQEGWTDA